jgi:hypothetical protein
MYANLLLFRDITKQHFSFEKPMNIAFCSTVKECHTNNTTWISLNDFSFHAVRHRHLELTETDGRHTVPSDAMTDLSPIFGSQVPGLPQNHDVVKARCHKRYTNFRRAKNMTQLSLVTCEQKLSFPWFRRVLILCMLCTDYCNTFTTYSYLFFSDMTMPVFCTIACSLTNSNLVNLSCWTDIVTSDTPTFNL